MFRPERLWTARLPLTGEVLRLGNLLRTHERGDVVADLNGDA